MVSDEPCPTDCPNRNVPASVPRPRLRSLRKPSSFSLSLGNSIINFRVLHLFLLKRIADRERSHRAKSAKEDGPLRGPRRIAPPGRITRAASRPQTDRSARPPGTLDGPTWIAPPGRNGTHGKRSPPLPDPSRVMPPAVLPPGGGLPVPPRPPSPHAPPLPPPPLEKEWTFHTSIQVGWGE